MGKALLAGWLTAFLSIVFVSGILKIYDGMNFLPASFLIWAVTSIGVIQLQSWKHFKFARDILNDVVFSNSILLSASLTILALLLLDIPWFGVLLFSIVCFVCNMGMFLKIYDSHHILKNFKLDFVGVANIGLLLFCLVGIYHYYTLPPKAPVTEIEIEVPRAKEPEYRMSYLYEDILWHGKVNYQAIYYVCFNNKIIYVAIETHNTYTYAPDYWHGYSADCGNWHIIKEELKVLL